MEWKPDSSSDTPLYKQIAEFLRSKISLGEWAIGTKIPSQRELAALFKVNRSTIVAALGELIAEGLLAGNTRGGTKVINHTWNLIAASPPPDWSDYAQAGAYYPNQPAVQLINRAEFQPGVVRLGTGELSPELLPAEEMNRMLEESSGHPFTLGYEEPAGNVTLRQNIAAYLKGIGIRTSASNILIVSGALQGLHLISTGLLHRGSTILVEKPSYLYSVHVFQSSAIKFIGLPMDEEGLQTKLISRYRSGYNASLLYTVPSFHNPTGCLMTEPRRQQLMQVCADEGLPIIEDDVYRELWFDSPPPLPLKARDPNALVLYLGSLSKTLSPGLRIGWVVAPEPVIERLADIKMQQDYGSSSLSQWVAAKWLGSGMYETHLTDVRAQLKRRRDLTLQLLHEYFSEIAVWTVPAGGFYVWLRFTVDLPMQLLFDRALKQGILINPGSIYDRNAGGCLRISYAYASLSELEWGLARLAELARMLLVKS
ncbi:PLP-dependent aminotransferase family protein [Paenibacillus sp. R14(2021)]|uniref:aminotransferase-like domain-containing protein n=1 Tax=Paenibacillus sp. R14(2021) TaxID=2859228 RepID=UPI00280A8B0E|nr:PLP-dependent aminotransferase family protein [Paenibacillus sp. R14(2021)]